MNSIVLNRLMEMSQNGAKLFKHMLLFEIDDVSINDVVALLNIASKISIVTSNVFLSHLMSTRFKNDQRVESGNPTKMVLHQFDLLVAQVVDVSIEKIVECISSISTVVSYNPQPQVDLSRLGFNRFEDSQCGLLSRDVTNQLIYEGKERIPVKRVRTQESHFFRWREPNEKILRKPIVPPENLGFIDFSRLTTPSSLKSKPKGKVSFFVVNFNTKKLITLLIASIHKNVTSFDYDIWVFDNSDHEKLELDSSWTDVHVIDNTRGQCIDYAKELPKYSKGLDGTKVVGWISLRHGLALQYALEDPRISDDCILLDSDVMVLRDLDWINSDMICIGTMEKKDWHPRLVPFLCYINKRFYREYHLKYVDEFRFLGVKGRDGRMCFDYDTGGSFLEDAMRADRNKCKFIDIFDYCIHFGSGSRNDIYAKKKVIDIEKLAVSYGLEEFLQDPGKKAFTSKISFEDQLEMTYEEIANRFEVKNESGKTKTIVYTAIIGDYDNLQPLTEYDDTHFDYVCFTTSPKIHSDKWKIIDVSDLKTLLKLNDNTKIARFIKTHPHLFFKTYSKSLWIDSNNKIVSKDLYHDFLPLLDATEYLLVPQHPKLDSIEQEANAIVHMKKDTKENVEKLLNLLKLERFKNIPGEHVQTHILLRRHMNKECMNIMERWWEMILNYSKRDQLSFNYVFHKWHGHFVIVPFKDVEKFIKWNVVHSY